MHELSLARAIVDAAERHAAGRRVTAVDLRIGTLRQVVPESLAFYFDVAARGTACEGADLGYEQVAAAMRCSLCGVQWDLANGLADLPTFRCRDCGQPGEVVRGDEFEVESITVEERPDPASSSEAKEDACTAPR